MAHLIAQGESRQNRWRRKLPPGREVVIGRTAQGWSATWDERISRRHASLLVEDGALRVRKMRDAPNPIFYQGREQTEFRVTPGGHFVIGSTTFSLVEEQLGVTLDLPAPLTERTFSRQTLEGIPYRNVARLVDAMSRLPDIIAGAGDDNELFGQLVELLFRAIESATFAAVVRRSDDREMAETEVLHWDHRSGEVGSEVPSERLIHQALMGKESVVHIWHEKSASSTNFTQAAETDWAFCTPVRGEFCSGLALYVAGRARQLDGTFALKDTSELQDSVKFTELTALTLAHLRSLRQLDHHKSTLGQFISPVVLEAVAGHDPESVLAPREANVSVLFCDLRGFSLTSERSSHDLIGLLNRVSLALGVMTRQILAHEGVIGDFHGDAAMGFWGWPLEQDNAVECACRSALQILDEFTAAHQDHPLADFRVGIGMASGAAVAGKIGTADQVKVTVFGPVVNLASRLEEMTKLLRAPILMDDVTARIVRAQVPRSVARVRRVANIRPYGLQSAVEVSQLLPSEQSYPQLSDADIATYESALDLLLDHDWDAAFEKLHYVPAEDRVKDFLTVFIAQNNRTPPANWDGVIPLSSKS